MTFDFLVPFPLCLLLFLLYKESNIPRTAMSSYDHEPLASGEEIITPSQFKESMRLVRLQIAVPISVLIAMGANLVCALAIKPGLGAFIAFESILYWCRRLM